MRAVLLFGIVVACAAVNLLLNFYAPAGMKLLLVPVFGLAFVLAIKVFRRPG